MMVAAGLENAGVRQVLNPARSQVAEHQRVTDRCGPQRHADKRHGMCDARPRCNYAQGTVGDFDAAHCHTDICESQPRGDRV
jgi:hypothetical protein